MKQRPGVSLARLREVQPWEVDELAPEAKQQACSRIGKDQLERLAPLMQQELRKLALLGRHTPADALVEIQCAIFGRHSTRQERRLFLSVAARVARRVAIEIAPTDEHFEACDISVAELGVWLERQAEIDPVAVQVVDLYCFAGVGLRETGRIVGLEVNAVKRTLCAMLANRSFG